MKWKVLFVLCLVLTSCAGRERRKVETPVFRENVPLNEVEPSPAPPDLEDWRGKDSGGELPPWLFAYLAGGNRAVEVLDEYSSDYAFVYENRSPSAEHLRQWLDRFDTKRAFPRMAATRLRYRFTRDISEKADDLYGRGFEAAVKAAYNSSYTGPRKEDDFWVVEKEKELPYRCFVLVLVPRDVFENQINRMLLTVSGEVKEVPAAFHRLRENFFEGF